MFQLDYQSSSHRKSKVHDVFLIAQCVSGNAPLGSINLSQLLSRSEDTHFCISTLKNPDAIMRMPLFYEYRILYQINRDVVFEYYVQLY